MISPRATLRPQEVRLVVAATISVALWGCGAGWRRADIGRQEFAPRQQVQVWRQSSAAQWHGVKVAADSISGIPYNRPVECDSCRISFPLASVDSVRLGNPMVGFWKTVGLVYGGLLALCVAVCPRDMN